MPNNEKSAEQLLREQQTMQEISTRIPHDVLQAFDKLNVSDLARNKNPNVFNEKIEELKNLIQNYSKPLDIIENLSQRYQLNGSKEVYSSGNQIIDQLSKFFTEVEGEIKTEDLPIRLNFDNLQQSSDYLTSESSSDGLTSTEHSTPTKTPRRDRKTNTELANLEETLKDLSGFLQNSRFLIQGAKNIQNEENDLLKNFKELQNQFLKTFKQRNIDINSPYGLALKEIVHNQLSTQITGIFNQIYGRDQSVSMDLQKFLTTLGGAQPALNQTVGVSAQKILNNSEIHNMLQRIQKDVTEKTIPVTSRRPFTGRR